MWDFLNGKKTIIATIAGVLAAFIQQVVIGTWHAEASLPWITGVVDVLNWLVMTLGTTGLVHKAIKAGSDTPS